MTGLTWRKGSRLGLMGHVIADDPSDQCCRDIIQVMATAGVDFIEIQIPFSEPVADGPLFALANQQALARGTKLKHAQDLMKEVSLQFPKCQFLFMSYLNPIYVRGYEFFCQEAAAVGARGVIVADLPFEECEPLNEACRSSGLTRVQILTPNTRLDRLEVVVPAAEGLIYVTARTGVTGAISEIGGELKGFVERVRHLTSVPVAVGFGISSPDHIKALMGTADVAVVGSAALRIYQEGGLVALREFWQRMVHAARE